MKFYWTDINRGRYLCQEHGGFCHDDDGHSLECPICQSKSIRDANFNEDMDTRFPIKNNSVARLISQLNGYQSRTGSLIKGVAAIGALLLPLLIKDVSSSPNGLTIILVATGSVLVAVMAFYLHILSNRDFGTRIKIVDKTPSSFQQVPGWIVGSQMPEKMTHDEWHKELLTWVAQYERRRIIGDVFMTIGVVCVVVGAQIWVLF